MSNMQADWPMTVPMVRAIVVQNEQVLLGRLSSAAFRGTQIEALAGRWDLIGGSQLPGEGAEWALKRALSEELAILPDTPVYCGRVSGRNGADTLSYECYRIEGWRGGAPRRRNATYTELRWFDLESACRLTDLALPGYRPLLRAAMGVGREGRALAQLRGAAA